MIKLTRDFPESGISYKQSKNIVDRKVILEKYGIPPV